jgi:hypothetical protein
MKARKKRQNKHPIKLDEEDNRTLREWAKIITNMPRAKDEGHRFYCPICKRDWARPFGMPMSSAYCEDCQYKGCIKEAEADKICAYCERRLK